MKKSITITCATLLAASALFFTSCKKKTNLQPINISPVQIQTENVTFQIEPKREILMIALHLANVNAFQSQYDYVINIDRMFEKQKDHALIKQLKSAVKNYNGSATSELAIVNYISDDFTTLSVNKKNLPLELQDFWSKVDLDAFLNNFYDFTVNSNAARIFKFYEADWKRYVNNVHEFYVKNDKLLPHFYDYFFSPETKPQIIINASDMHPYYLINLPGKDDNSKLTLEVFDIPDISQKANNDIDYYIILTQSYINHLIYKYWDKISEKTTAIVNETMKQNQIDTKKFSENDYIYNLGDVLSFLLTFNYAKEVKDEIVYEDYKSYIYKTLLFNELDIVLALFEEYENNREKYPVFEDFFSARLIDELNNNF